MMKISQSGINLIENWERFRAEPYQDGGGVWTVGFGHTRTASQSMRALTLIKAEVLLLQDVAIVEAQINSTFKNLKQHQFDALVSLVFNIGWGNFKKSKTYKYLLANPNDKHVAYEWIGFCNDNGEFVRGLLLRRLDEIKLYWSVKL